MIDFIDLKNFKSFSDVSVSLGTLTLLSGANGSGKSTVLQSLGVLRQSFEAGCLSPNGGLLLNGDYVDLGVGKDVLCEYSDSPEITIAVRSGAESLSWNFAYAERDDLLQVLRSPVSGYTVPAWLRDGFQFLRADRIAPAIVYPKSYNHSVRHRFLGVQGQYVPYFLSVHQDEIVSEGRVRSDAASSQLLDQVNAWLANISPRMSVTASEIGGADLAQLFFRYGGSAGLESSNDYRPTNVGFGLTYVLPIIVACLAAREGDLLLLENPEAHLHPRGQTAMGELISRTAGDGVQVVVESHSDHLLNGIRLSLKRKVINPEAVRLHFCRRKDSGRGSEFVSPEIDESGRLSDWPDGFFDEWENSLLELV